MRGLAAIFLGSAAIDWPGLVLDRAGVALLGLALLALSLPASARRRARIAEKPRGPAIFEGDLELERDLAAASAAAVSYLDNARREA